jgi:TolB-like protein/Flp pilus assembly protein TadD
MSRVYLARDESLARDVVIKVLPRELAAEMSAERFTREIKLAAALQHPHVLPVLSAGVSDGLPYYMMPYVRGESLRAAMNNRSLSREQSLDILRDVARALRYAHEEGIVHRDIKPENILLSSGSAVVVDFGIAKALSASRTEAPGGTLTLVGTSIGTPAYMSPEQAAADPNIDHRADIYAWGVVAYELLAGKHPFDGKVTPQQYLRAHLAEAPKALSDVEPSIPKAISDVVMRALEKDADKRHQSAGEILSGLGTTGSASIESIASPTRQSKWRVPAMALGALALVAVAVGMWKRPGSANAESPVMLAVLPFENQGPAEQDYFVDGLTDAVNGKLAGLSGISVIDRRSTSQYRNTTKPVQQIGSELGVQYVLGGVVRWAQGDSGWRAQVMPTLVNTSDATTRWAGEPVVVSSADPFSAQTEIASKVAGALRLALASSERRELAEHPTENTAAYDAFLRGKAMLESNWRVSSSVRNIDAAIAELRRAITLDPEFASAWAFLARALYQRSADVPGDTASFNRSMEAAKKAASFDANDPLIADVQSAIAWMAGDRDGAVKILGDAVKRGVKSPELLANHAFDLFDAGKIDAAREAMAEALRMNPRFPQTLLAASDFHQTLREWGTAERHARTLTTVDPTDERGWSELASMARNRGDTSGIRRAVTDAFRNITSPSNVILVFMVYAGDEMGSRFVRMTPEQLHIESLVDSVATYYDNKADFYLGKGDMARARVYLDSIIGKLEGRNLAGPSEAYLRIYLSHSYAATGKGQLALAELERAKAAAIAAGNVRRDGSPNVDGRIAAAIFGGSGKHREAIEELRRFVELRAWTRAGLAQEPKLKRFVGLPEWRAFFRERDAVTR